MFCAIWYHLYNFKNVKNIHGRVLLLVKLQAFSLKLYEKLHSAMGVFHVFKILQMVPNPVTHHIVLKVKSI